MSREGALYACRARDAQMLQMLVSANECDGESKPLACLSFYLSCQASASCPADASLLDEVFNMYSSHRIPSRLKCAAIRVFETMLENAHEDNIDVAKLAPLYDCCDHPSWTSIMSGVNAIGAKKNRRMFFPEFIKLIQQVCKNIDKCVLELIECGAASEQLPTVNPAAQHDSSKYVGTTIGVPAVSAGSIHASDTDGSVRSSEHHTTGTVEEEAWLQH